MSALYNEAQYNAVAGALVKCGEVRSKLRAALSQIEAWSDMERSPCEDESALRARMAQLNQVANDMKDYEP